MAAARVTFQDILSDQATTSDLVVPLDCREATLYITFTQSGDINHPMPLVNGVRADRFMVASCQDVVTSGNFLLHCRVDFPSIFDQDGIPVNYNDQLTISGVSGSASLDVVSNAVCVLKRVYFDPDLDDPNQPAQRR